MKSQPDPLDGFSQQGDELPLSGLALSQLLQAVIQRGKPFRFRARGGSMSPFIKDGDVVTVAPLGSEAPSVGDVVAFRRCPERLVVHRIVGVHDGDYVILGDSVPDADDAVKRADILGRVVRVERNGKLVRLGMGPERGLIARLTRSGLFVRVVIPLWIRVRPFLRRSS